MQEYYCGICHENHMTLDHEDEIKRIKECDLKGHVKNCVTPEKDGTYWCAYCARKISEEEYNKAQEKS